MGVYSYGAGVQLVHENHNRARLPLNYRWVVQPYKYARRNVRPATDQIKGPSQRKQRNFNTGATDDHFNVTKAN